MKKESRRCPWCECWEPQHTLRCWWVQRNRAHDPWGNPKNLI